MDDWIIKLLRIGKKAHKAFFLFQEGTTMDMNKVLIETLC